MSTLHQQLAFALLTLLFGILASGVVRHSGSRPPGRQEVAWRITAAYFVLIGGYAVVHSVFAIFAVRAGQDSTIYAHVVRWVGPANVGRAITGVAFALLVLHAQVRRPGGGRITAQAVPLLLLTAVGATVAADVLRSDGMLWQASMLALWATVMALLLFPALLLALMWDGMDEVLWLALTAYVLKEVLSVSLWAMVAWRPRGAASGMLQMFYWVNLVVMLGMCIAAAWRLRQAAAGRRVPSLFERVRAIRPPTMGWDNLR